MVREAIWTPDAKKKSQENRNGKALGWKYAWCVCETARTWLGLNALHDGKTEVT